MPITQERMVDLIESAREFLDIFAKAKDLANKGLDYPTIQNEILQEILNLNPSMDSVSILVREEERNSLTRRRRNAGARDSMARVRQRDAITPRMPTDNRPFHEKANSPRIYVPLPTTNQELENELAAIDATGYAPGVAEHLKNAIRRKHKTGSATEFGPGTRKMQMPTQEQLERLDTSKTPNDPDDLPGGTINKDI